MIEASEEDEIWENLLRYFLLKSSQGLHISNVMKQRTKHPLFLVDKSAAFFFTVYFSKTFRLTLKPSSVEKTAWCYTWFKNFLILKRCTCCMHMTQENSKCVLSTCKLLGWLCEFGVMIEHQDSLFVLRNLLLQWSFGLAIVYKIALTASD